MKMETMTVEQVRNEVEKEINNLVSNIKGLQTVEEAIDELAGAMVYICAGCITQRMDAIIRLKTGLIVETATLPDEDKKLVADTAERIILLAKAMDGWHDFMSEPVEKVMIMNRRRGQCMTPSDVARQAMRLLGTSRTETKKMIKIAEICCGTGALAMAELGRHADAGNLGKVKILMNDIDLRLLRIAVAQVLTLQTVNKGIVGEIQATTEDVIRGGQIAWMHSVMTENAISGEWLKAE